MYLECWSQTKAANIVRTVYMGSLLWFPSTQPSILVISCVTFILKQEKYQNLRNTKSLMGSEGHSVKVTGKLYHMICHHLTHGIHKKYTRHTRHDQTYRHTKEQTIRQAGYKPKTSCIDYWSRVIKMNYYVALSSSK